MQPHRVHLLSDALAAGRSPQLMQRLRTQATALGLDLGCRPVRAGEDKIAAVDAVIWHLSEEAAPVAEIGVCRVAVVVSEAAIEPATRPAIGCNGHLIQGRGETGFKWALRFIAAQLAHRSVKFNYGPEPDQTGWLTQPRADRGAGGLHPVAVLVHGGFWRDLVALDHMAPLSAYLAARGWVGCNLEYRRQRHWHESCQDILRALMQLPDHVARFGGDLSRVVLIGHSSGVQLLHGALAEGQRQLNRRGIRARLMVSLAGLLDMAAAEAAGLGADAVQELIRGSASVPRIYDPLAQNLDTPMLLVHGAADHTVPPAQSRSYLARQWQNGSVDRLMLVEDVDHMDLIKPELPHWPAIEHEMAGAVMPCEESIA